MWKLLGLLICSYTTYAFAAAAKTKSCSIKLPDIKGFAPVILTAESRNNYKLFKPTGEITSLKEGSKLRLVCTGNKNVFENTSFDTLELKCSKGNFVDANNNVQPLSELVCKSIPSSTMKITNEECSNGNGYIYETGFIIEDEFYGPVFEICYSNVTENTFYTHGILNGAAMDYSISESTRRSFTADGMQFTTTKANTFYTQKNQIKRFEQYFGSDQTYIDTKNFLARGHLAADADFIFGYEKLATYYYANVAPEFQLINAGNWLRVEELARLASANYKDDIESYNSYMGILELPNNNGDLVEIYLDDTQKIEVPKYYFKVLVHRASDSSIVFVTVNNPYIEDGPAEEICTNVCEKSGLVHANFPDVTKGYTFCCELEEFKQWVDFLPEEVQGSNLLMRNL
ncbi:hypothetical protein FF38_02191 [Lucilia cuprina]|uniref:DNA/RNA non-specific endonuclease domain-containing protein n=1 Tax=Lucilia cuprina TaxID=7375 RepID=A0A0L0BW11_LUCCU|nr:hypothetical protein CVS40_6887 [Lucilia cuprina]KNC24208.1 hypothetical protein FF38_02191 [Lucilia cuprina]